MDDKEKQKLLDQALDRLMSGPVGQRKEWQWDQSAWMRTDENIAKSEEARKKMSISQKKSVKTEKWRKSRSRYMTGRANPEHSKRMSGEGNANFNKGYEYTELTTGFTGTCKEVSEHFNITQSNLQGHAIKGKLITSGKSKGLHFVRSGSVKRKTKTPSTFYLELTTNTKGSALELYNIFGISQPCLILHSKNNRPVKRGKLKGLHFIKLDIKK